ncbi:MAG: HEAT repeat domain-containing protein [Gemmatimonadaceae bacterium]|nr:HEAT repeat domain-containing protein [Gemmatimonadaceae bacterium]
MLVILWAGVVAIITGSLGYSALAVRRIIRAARPLETQDWLTPLWEVSDRLSLDEPPRLLRSEEAKMPFACGLFQPTIVLPAECDAWSPDRRRAVLLHELAHVRRHDLVGHTLGRIACALYWFHPLVWTAAKQLRSESERACDDLALACGARASDYAEHLLDIVTSVRRDTTPAVALAMARRKEFEGRMLAILDPELRHSSPGRRQSAALIASLALISIVVGAAAPAPRADRGSETIATNIELGTPSAPDHSLPADVPDSKDDAMVEAKSDAAVALKPGAPKVGAGIVPNVTQATETVAPETNREVARTKLTDQVAAAFQRLNESASARSAQGRADDRPVLLANVLRSDTSASLRRIAAWGLSEFAESPVAITALSSALRRDANASVREMAAWAMSNCEDGNSTVIESLSAALRGDSEPKVRGIAAWALGHVGDRDATAALAAALGDADVSVRRRAAWALGHVEPREAPRPLVDMLKDRDPKARELAAWALYQIEDRNTVAALDAALRIETDKDLQLAYIRALAAIGEHSVDAIRGLLDSRDQRIRTMAVRALAGGNAAGPWPWPWPEPRPFP